MCKRLVSYAKGKFRADLLTVYKTKLKLANSNQIHVGCSGIPISGNFLNLEHIFLKSYYLVQMESQENL